MIKKTLKGPLGAKLHLDSSQVYPDDPGNGTPALVEYQKHFGTYWCCSDTYDCDGIELPSAIVDWLNSEKIQAEVAALGA